MTTARRFLDRAGAARIVGSWAIWSAAVLMLAAIAMTLPVRNGSPWTAVYQAPPLARWDAVWYRSIAAEGYHAREHGRDANVGWYPLYPLLVRWAAGLLHLPILWTGIGLSLAFLLLALLLAGDLYAEWGGTDAAVPAVAAILLFPTSFYFASVYSESLFFLTTATAIWAGRRALWPLAALGGIAAALTRFNGILVALPLTGYAARAMRRDGRVRLAPAAAALAPVAGALLYPLYLWRRWGDPLLYVHDRVAGSSVAPKPVWRLAAAVWRDLQGRLTEGARPDDASYVLRAVAAILFLGLAVALFRRGLAAEGSYVAATLLLLLHSGTLDGLDRYVLVLFPGFFVLAEFLRRRPVIAFGYVVLGSGLGTTFLYRFVHWFMVS